MKTKAKRALIYKTINGNGETVEFARGFTCWKMNFNGYQSYDPVTNPWIEYTKDRTLRFSVADIINNYYPNYSTSPQIGGIYFIADYLEPLGCIADDSLITLADGSQKKVQDLTGNESLLVWNLFTGTFDTAPILFIDKDVRQQYKIVNLYFSDGTKIKVIYEHAFWDFTLNKYVFLRNDSDKYIIAISKSLAISMKKLQTTLSICLSITSLICGGCFWHRREFGVSSSA